MKKILVNTVLLSSVVLADNLEMTLQDEISWLQEETFVISASKIKENIKKAPSSITVIDEDTINKMGANNLLDVLRVVSGLGVSQSNIYVDKINVRGIETWFSEKILILLDGHSLNVDLLNGGATGAYKDMPIELIKRVEVIKGPASALYGENAFTALINIITKEADDIDGVQVSARVGSFNTATANLLFGKTCQDYKVTAGMSYKKSDGYSAYIEKDSIGNSMHTSPTLKNLNAYISLSHENGLYAKANYSNTEDGSKYGITHAINNEDKSKRESYFLELGYKYNINNMYHLNSRIYYDYYKYDNTWRVFPDGFPASVYTDGMLAYVGIDNSKQGFETLLTVNGNNYNVVSGLSYELQKIEDPWQRMNWNPVTNAPLSSIQDFSDPSTNYVSEEDRRFLAIYSELHYDVTDSIRVTAGARYDHYSDFGGIVNPRAGIAYEVNKNNTVKLMYGHAFRAPTFAELYNTNNPSILGNPDLNPEKVRTLELNFQNRSIDSLQTSLTMFYSEIKDIISINAGKHENQDKITTKGFEVEAKYKLNRGSYIQANYTYQDPKNDLTDQKLENISNHEAYIALNKRVSRHLNLYIDAKYAGEQTRPSTDARSEVKSSVIGNATLLAKDLVLKDLSMKFSVYNLLDKESYDSNAPYDYPLPGRSYMAELGYKF